MNVWKPIAIFTTAALVATIGYQTAQAQSNAGDCHNQPNMAAAVRSFHAARASLDKAEHNKGGWRDRAIKAADAAIHETENGCAFADIH
jgi:hypothetical protein